VLRAWPRGRTAPTLRVADLPPRYAGVGGVDALTRAVDGFEQSWDPSFRLFSHDCRDYCEGLIEALTDGQCCTVCTWYFVFFVFLAWPYAGRRSTPLCGK
jgi:hypothetical protein